MWNNSDSNYEWAILNSDNQIMHLQFSYAEKGVGDSQIRMRDISEAFQGTAAESYLDFAFSAAPSDQTKVASREGEHVGVVVFTRLPLHTNLR